MKILISEGILEYPVYHPTLSSALETAREFIKKREYEFVEEDPLWNFASGGIPYGGRKSETIKIASKDKRKYLVITIVNLSALGRPLKNPYEINMYIDGSWKNLHEGREYDYESILGVTLDAKSLLDAEAKAKAFIGHLHQEHPKTNARLYKKPTEVNGKYYFELNVTIETPEEAEQEKFTDQFINHLKVAHGDLDIKKVFVPDSPIKG